VALLAVRTENFLVFFDPQDVRKKIVYARRSGGELGYQVNRRMEHLANLSLPWPQDSSIHSTTNLTTDWRLRMLFVHKRSILTLFTSASLTVLLAFPAYGRQGGCAAGGSAGSSSSTGSTTAGTGNALASARISPATTQTTATAQANALIGRQVAQLQRTQLLLQTGAITLPQNSQVTTAQVQAQIQQRINQLQLVQLQLLRGRR